jgi:hypothetical protein
MAVEQTGSARVPYSLASPGGDRRPSPETLEFELPAIFDGSMASSAAVATSFEDR